MAGMQVASVTQSDARLILETVTVLLNGLAPVSDGGEGPSFDLRAALIEAGFTRAPKASAASISRLGPRVDDLRSLFEALPGQSVDDAAQSVNEQLAELTIVPAVVRHDGVGPHLHWTSSAATFDDQVVADMLMALALELCEDGTERFGRCGAVDCERLFYDGTRNRSRRFCDDKRCASRTHTADHRARRRSA